MEALKADQVRVNGGFWQQRLTLNATRALRHQWQMLEESGCIDNFRIAAGNKDRFREGYFFADSDAYKWLDAASCSLAQLPDPALAKQVDEFVDLLEQACAPDGYLYTYNQIHFPNLRWQNLQIEHEFYCLGHLIEAGISHARATGTERMLNLVRRSADLLVKLFMDAGPAFTDGHEEIEIALIRLFRATHNADYLELARRFLERRGRIPGFGWLFLKQSINTSRRMKIRDQMRSDYTKTHPSYKKPQMPSRLLQRVPFGLPLRAALHSITGKYFQQNAPIRQQTQPIGHAVRFTYLEAATAMLLRESGDASLLPALEQAWQRMVTRRMFVTGGIGSLPLTEGFGRDFELHPEIAYAETCAALGSMLWSWEMTLATGQPQYADLFEWQLYNAASVSMALDGCSYFYDNPLTCTRETKRERWYSVPCCPSNLSRVWAGLGQYIYSRNPDSLCIHQYISHTADIEPGVRLEMHSGLPWDGQVRISFNLQHSLETTLQLRIPSWAGETIFTINGQPIDAAITRTDVTETASDFNPYQACVARIERAWQNGDRLEIKFAMPVHFRKQDTRIPACGGMNALTRGPLVYCLESVDNPNLDILNIELNPASVQVEWAPDTLGGVNLLRAQTSSGRSLIFVPFMTWANRGAAKMTVFFKP